MNYKAQDVIGDTRRSVLIKDHLKKIKKEGVEKHKLIHSMKKSTKVNHDPVERHIKMG